MVGQGTVLVGQGTWVRGRFSDPLGLETFNNKGTVLLLERSANLTKEPSLCLNNNIIPGTKIYDAPHGSWVRGRFSDPLFH